MTEIWMPCVTYLGYEASNTGKIRYNGRILSTTISPRGYERTNIKRPGNQKKYSGIGIHRLIALAFIPNPERKEQVNHINGIKTDNSVANLEWCSNAENQKHAWDNGLRTFTDKGRTQWEKVLESQKTNHPNSKKVIDTATGTIYNSIREAADSKGLNKGTLEQWLKGSRRNKSTFLYYSI